MSQLRSSEVRPAAARCEQVVSDSLLRRISRIVVAGAAVALLAEGAPGCSRTLPQRVAMIRPLPDACDATPDRGAVASITYGRPYGSLRLACNGLVARIIRCQQTDALVAPTRSPDYGSRDSRFETCVSPQVANRACSAAASLIRSTATTNRTGAELQVNFNDGRVLNVSIQDVAETTRRDLLSASDLADSEIDAGPINADRRSLGLVRYASRQFSASASTDYTIVLSEGGMFALQDNRIGCGTTGRIRTEDYLLVRSWIASTDAGPEGALLTAEVRTNSGASTVQGLFGEVAIGAADAIALSLGRRCRQ